jgi:hypothetical protein
VSGNSDPIHVHLDGTASAAEVASVRQLFEEQGIEVDVDASYGIGGDIPDVAIWILVISPAVKFLNEIASSAARRLVEAVWDSRTRERGYQGIVAVADSHYLPEAKFSAILEPNLPMSAYADLHLLANKLKRGKIRYDSSARGWVVDDEELRSQLEYLYAERASLLLERRTPWWKLWPWRRR